MTKRYPEFEELLLIIGDEPKASQDTSQDTSQDIPCIEPMTAKSGRKLSAYQVFMHNVMDQLKKDQPELRIQEKFRQAVARWRGLTTEQKSEIKDSYCRN